MKDLYKQYGLRPLVNNRELIVTEIKKASPADRRAGEYVLLHKDRKAIYDRTFRNLSFIGQLRSKLKLTQTDHWDYDTYSDFTEREAESEWHTAEAWNSAGSQSSNYYSTTAKENRYVKLDHYVKRIAMFVSGVFLLAVFIEVINSPSISRPQKASSPVTYKKPMHVTSKALNLREKPSIKSHVITTLKQYQNVYVDSKPVLTSWIYVEASDGQKGYVSSKYLAAGYGSVAQDNECRAKGVTRPKNGAVFSQKKTGIHQLIVNNNPGTDAIVKLKDPNFKTMLEFYVRSGQTVKIKDVPEGHYQFYYATGKDYSKDCHRFLKDMQVSRDRSSTPYISKQMGNSTIYAIQTYTLKRVRGGNFTPQTVSASDF